MKKTLLIIVSFFALLAVSCTQEKLENPAGQEVEVTFTASLPGDIATKAYAEGSKVKNLIYAVYNTGETKPVYEGSETLKDGKTANIKLNLVSGKKYDFAFWAYAPENKAYEVKFDGQTMTVHYDKILANDEYNDAFYTFKQELQIDGPTSEKVELFRPFAQINLGTDDLKTADDNTVNVTRSSMTLTVANVLNFATGEVTGEDVFTYAVNKIPVTSEQFPFPYSAGEKKYDYLAMNYVLVGKEQSITDCEFAIYEGENTTATNTVRVANVPVRRNYRTNIYGSLITDPTDVGVEVRPGINGDPDLNKEVTELPATTPEEEFYQTLSKGKDVVITGTGRGKIDFNNLTIAEDLTLTLEAPVDEIVLGGNNEVAAAADTKATATKPNVTIVVAKDVKFPKFKFNGTTENYIIRGFLDTNNPLTEVIETSGNVKNFTVENVKATGNARIKGNNHTVGFTVKNCVATDLNAGFVRIFESRNAKILNNTVALAASANPTGDDRHAIEVYNCGDDILIEGNTITKTFKHGIFVQGVETSALTIKNNKISGVVEDGIKIDRSHKVVVTGNVIDAPDYGIRVDRLKPSLGSADITITDNTISIDGVDNENNPATAIRVRHRNEDDFAGEVTVNLTAKGNRAGANGIPSGCYVNFTSEGMTVTGDYENAFDGAIYAGGNYYNTLAEVIAAGYTDIILPAGEYTLSQSDREKNLKITGKSAEATKVKLAGGDLRWKTAELNDVTIISPATGDGPQGGVISEEGTTVHNNCVIENVYFCLGIYTEFNGCIFNMANPNAYNVWTYGSNASFKNCEFYSAGKAALVFGHNRLSYTAETNFKDCKFYASAPATGKAAIEIDSRYTPFDVNIENCTSEGFDLGTNSKNSLYNLKYGTLGVNCTITVDGISYLADGFTLDIANKTYSVSNANGLRYFADDVNVRNNTFGGKTVQLTADIDLENKAWTPVGQTGATQFQGTFDGQKHTISNLDINSLEHTGDYSSGLFGWLNGAKVLNLNVDKAKVVGHRRVGVIAGYVEGTATIDHCSVSNIMIEAIPEQRTDEQYDNGDKVGGIAGFIASYPTTVSNCTVSGGTVKAYRDCGGLVGMAYSQNIIKDNVVSDLKVISDQSICTAAKYDNGSGEAHNAGAIIGRGGESFISGNTAESVTVETIANKQ